MEIQPLLQSLDLGNSVAEFDQELEQYFLETDTFRAVVSGEVDIVSGDKGTGKTAIYRYLERNYRTYPELDGVELLTAFNPSGSPIFQRLVYGGAELTEVQYATIWKAYILALTGNWLVHISDGALSPATARLDRLLKFVGLSTLDALPKTVFPQIAEWLKRHMNPSAAELGITVTEQGLPLIKPRVEFEDYELSEIPGIDDFVYHDDALRILDEALEEADIHVWLLFDRLDEAFTGFPNVEIPALRALLRTYLDLQNLRRIKLKLFLRRDLFRKITAGKFVNLTHVNAKRRDIVWDDDDLFQLLIQRVRGSAELIDNLSAKSLDDQALFYRLFPPQVDRGEKKPTTWNWMLYRIRDGNGVKPPRNLIDLAGLAREEQIRREEREPRQLDDGSLIESDSLKRALTRLSEHRVQDTLLAEAASHIADHIRKFRDGKAEHNLYSLKSLLNIDESRVRDAVEGLTDVGFLEPSGDNFKVPPLYRDGLSITQGKAF